MREQAEIDAEIAHVEYSQSIFSERLTALKAERDLLREDTYAKDKLTKRLAEFFKVHGLYIVSYQSRERSKEHYALAKQVWRAKATLLPFIKALSRNKKPSFDYDTQSMSPTEKTDIINLCDNLRKQEGLSYDIFPNKIQITPSLKGHHKNFFSGAWAEEVTLYLIDKALKKFTQTRKLKHILFWDVKLKQVGSNKNTPNDMQLDLVAQVADRFYVFETKSGFILCIDKWVDRAHLFDDKKNRFITCTADETLNPRIFHPFRLFALPTLETQFTQMLEKDFTENPALPISATVPTPEKKV